MILPDLNAALSEGDRSEKAYKTIRAKHPLVDDVRFRRIMGTSEAVSEWRWPVWSAPGAPCLPDHKGRSGKRGRFEQPDLEAAVGHRRTIGEERQICGLCQ